MKTKQLFLACLLAVAGSGTADAYDIDHNGLYYNITGENTVEVTYVEQGDGNRDFFSGNINIPRRISTGGKTYTVTAIGDYAFNFCKNLTSVTIPEGVTSIGYEAFYGCDGLTSITIPSSVTSIGDYAFFDCDGLTSITIPSSVTSIGNSAFFDCSGLTSITIPSSVTSIGNSAFFDCSGLTSITIPSSVTSIGVDAFSYCRGLTSITIPSSVTSIGNSAFSWCDGLTSITIPNSVTSIGNWAFSGCSGLETITVDAGNKFYDSRNGCNAIIEKQSGTLIAGCKNTIVPEGVTSIGDYAFYVCDGLTSITIPNSVTSIGEAAFNQCRGLTSITIPSSVTSIGNSAFSWCDGLTSITIPSNVTSIGYYAFRGCPLKTVTSYVEEPFTYGFNSFSDIRSDAVLYIPVGTRDKYISAGWTTSVFGGGIVEFIHGDVNSDNEVDVVDVVDIARFVVDTPSTAFVKPLADLNFDGNVNVADAVTLVNEIAGDQNFVKGLYAPKAGGYDYDLCELQLLRRSDGGLAFCLDGEADFTAFQCVVEVPEGTEVTAMRLNGGRRQGHQLLYNKVSDGTYRVAVLSVANNAFLGNEGELLGIALDGVADGDISIRDIHFVNTAGKDFTFDALHVGDGIVTGVEEMATTALRQGATEIYDLQGRLRPTLQRGVNIVGGKKRIVR